jgi:hypothetical protein
VGESPVLTGGPDEVWGTSESGPSSLAPMELRSPREFLIRRSLAGQPDGGVANVTRFVTWSLRLRAPEVPLSHFFYLDSTAI